MAGEGRVLQLPYGTAVLQHLPRLIGHGPTRIVTLQVRSLGQLTPDENGETFLDNLTRRLRGENP